MFMLVYFTACFKNRRIFFCVFILITSYLLVLLDWAVRDVWPIWHVHVQIYLKETTDFLYVSWKKYVTIIFGIGIPNHHFENAVRNADVKDKRFLCSLLQVTTTRYWIRYPNTWKWKSLFSTGPNYTLIWKVKTLPSSIQVKAWVLFILWVHK